MIALTSGDRAAPFVVETIETHAEGEPGRVIPNAERFVRGATMAERFDHCTRELNGLRRLLLREPRGYPASCGVFLLPPVSADADFGIIVLEQGGFTPMSGSNTICAVTAAVETGIVPVRGPDTEVVIDTAVGTVRATARVEETAGRVAVRAVTVANVPSYAVAIDLPLEVREFGEILVDVAFGGQFFVQLDIAQLGIELGPEQARRITRAAALVKLAALEQVPVRHPVNPAIDRIAMVMLHNGDRSPGKQARNANVLTSAPILPDREESWTGVLDRSPCGTGTSARMAALHARGQLAVGEDFSHRSIIDSEFVGRLVGETEVGEHRAVLPTITGRGWISGRATWRLDPSDPYREGYTLGDIWAA
ncbi:proline racemase family protein [Leucobacter weissii]|uniref:Proline racemase family protein n=1 Tax=Leucobacter weissii TaxID=1983706 RepID=A0A939MIK9_9MICO|nr:proline racemase family protein [Leucobacter weissii]MBO1901589.1 proline racemase family protein [Leucobacter weissii]